MSLQGWRWALGRKAGRQGQDGMPPVSERPFIAVPAGAGERPALVSRPTEPGGLQQFYIRLDPGLGFVVQTELRIIGWGRTGTHWHQVDFEIPVGGCVDRMSLRKLHEVRGEQVSGLIPERLLWIHVVTRKALTLSRYETEAASGDE